MDSRIKTVVIVGGGTAGWMTAASLIHALSHTGIKITLIESSEVGTVGVGEATIPTIREFYHGLGLSDVEVMRATQATCKLGIQFKDWNKIGQSFFHPFAHFGQSVNGVGFHHFWVKAKQAGYKGNFEEFSLGVALAKHGKFAYPSENPPSTMSVFDWALHFDAALFAKFLKDYSVARGVVHLDDYIQEVMLRPEDGFIESLSTQKNGLISADLFIDCSGFQGLLIEGALKTGYEDWSQWLLCDRAVAVQSELVGPVNPYTISAAESAGWRWQIPLQHRAGNGHVYSSSHCSDDKALQALSNSLPGKPISDPRIIKFQPGRRKKAWNKNCIAVGLSSGFLEPLESTSIALIELAIEKIKQFFPDKNCDSTLVDEFNERTRLEYERVRDFVIFHYKATSREDSEFWRYCKNMDVPDALSYKNKIFRAHGHLVKYPWEMFQAPSWLAIYNGYDYWPQKYSVMADRFDNDYLRRVFDEMRAAVMSSVARAEKHEDFLRQF